MPELHSDTFARVETLPKSDTFAQNDTLARSVTLARRNFSTEYHFSMIIIKFIKQKVLIVLN